MSLRKIIIIRHAESQEDIDPNLNGILEDHEISITKKGISQIERITLEVMRIVSNFKNTTIYSSISNRAVETSVVLKNKLRLPEVIFEPRIRNLNWGSTTPIDVKEIAQERYSAGVLYYQFPDGDHSPTFVSNIGKFVNDLLNSGKEKSFPEAIIIVTHGFSLRVITKFLLNMSDEDFRWVRHPKNCFIANFDIDDLGAISIQKPLPKREPI
jgi:broad specificity phosphatase PhoE